MKAVTWQEAVAAVQNKRADMFASVARTSQREKYALFTRPYVSMPINIFARNNISYIGDLRNLAGKRVAVVDGYAIHDWLKNEHPELQLVPVESPPEGLKQVSKGSLDVFVGNAVTSNYYLGKLSLDNVHAVGETPYSNDQAMAVRDDWPILAGILQKGLDAIPQSEHDLIFTRWMSIQFEQAIDRKLVWQILVVFIVVLLSIIYWNVTLRKKVQQRTSQYQVELNKRRKSEARFRNLVESTSDWIWEVGPDALYSYVSPKVEELLGYKPEELLGKSPLDLMPESEAERVAEKFGSIFTAQVPFHGLENINRHKDGHLVFIETAGVPIFDDNGTFQGYRGIDRDITERQRLVNFIRDTASVIATGAGETFFRDLSVKLANALQMRYVHVGELTTDGNHVKTLSVCFDQQIVDNFEYTLAGTPCENVTQGRPCAYPSGVRQQFPDDKEIQEMGFESYIGIPLYSAEKEAIGLIVALDSKPLKSIEFASSLLEVFSVRASAEMERLRYESELRRAAGVFENTTEGVVITDTSVKIIAVNKAFCEISGYSEEEVIGENPRMWKSEQHDESFYQTIWASLRETGRWQGEIWNHRKNGDVYPAWMTIDTIRDEKGQLDQFVSVYSDISAIKESEERLQFLAHHDPLTKLPNRLLFSARLEHALQHAHRQNELVAVMFLDLDNFKQINDGLGHPVGDKVLQKVARRLSAIMRDEDTVARMGGDEFALVLGDISDSMGASQVASKVLSVFEAPLEIDHHRLYVTSTLGISLYPSDGENVATLLKNADTAMYHAKEEGKNQFCFYTDDLNSEALEKLNLENDLREALNNDEFEVYYQPQYELSSGRLTGAEALIRWNHKELGLVPPDEFIPMAESNGLIIPIGRWIMKQACSQVKTWQEAGFDIDRIGVNVAGQQIQNSDIVETVKDVLKETKLEPACLELEITESFIMQQAEKAISTLEELRKIGVALAIDDFGTGYSSLSYLKRLPIDRLKIDRSFIKDIPYDSDGVAITKAIIALGKSMQLNVIAEGIETDEQHDFLTEKGCDEVQGYLYSRPLNAQEIEEIFQKEN
ncbi:hypothetical protein BOW22_11360 [Solemya velum gill symbiont]|nr:hypothetical protein BOW19_11365 [Solemya velum gill symbiont]OOY98997.1 hypothetical protein BOW20_11305 [Solemya velum gill symbiont]OOZ03407.1 hypothetical protein BOW22_11360 [Solemya velum gill symbiont]OOZ05607.1 hypothetical protein BOW23_11365 [Solemya velum gill symbiont]OOZ08030.1 hypothetical protein BOW24_11345 [Solemya velum gill symbiont]